MLAIVMPVFNEEGGIRDFVSELNLIFKNVNMKIFIVDDFSTDNTPNILTELEKSAQIGGWQRNSTNLGHGPSTLSAINLGVNSGAEKIITVDGDGQFLGNDLRRVFDHLNGSVSVVEGVRTNRHEPIFRKLVTFSVRCLVFIQSLKFPSDANTPLRAYTRLMAQQILSKIDNNCPIPNLVISAILRKQKIIITEVHVRSIPRRGSVESGTTWNQKHRHLPSKRFVKFCASSFRYWARNFR